MIDANEQRRRQPFRRGIVVEQDLTRPRVRVQFPAEDQLVSFWLPVLQRGSSEDKDFWVPDLGEQVACEMDTDLEDGVVTGTIPSQVDAAPEGATGDQRILQIKDGAIFKYDRAAHAFTASLPNGATFTVILNGATLKIDASGNLLCKPTGGDVEFQTSEFTTSLNQIISIFNTHVHSGVQSGSSDTAVPTTLIP